MHGHRLLHGSIPPGLCGALAGRRPCVLACRVWCAAHSAGPCLEPAPGRLHRACQPVAVGGWVYRPLLGGAPRLLPGSRLLWRHHGRRVRSHDAVVLELRSRYGQRGNDGAHGKRASHSVADGVAGYVGLYLSSCGGAAQWALCRRPPLPLGRMPIRARARPLCQTPAPPLALRRNHPASRRRVGACAP